MAEHRTLPQESDIDGVEQSGPLQRQEAGEAGTAWFMGLKWGTEGVATTVQLMSDVKTISTRQLLYFFVEQMPFTILDFNQVIISNHSNLC